MHLIHYKITNNINNNSKIVIELFILDIKIIHLVN